mmetsp:Transcript_89333/g.251498  ORF Transcript_89333/g.251498 Transcript_89333/m.251498 type:complete len:553 (-) Transcript_89333:32-1690(-)
MSRPPPRIITVYGPATGLGVNVGARQEGIGAGAVTQASMVPTMVPSPVLPMAPTARFPTLGPTLVPMLTSTLASTLVPAPPRPALAPAPAPAAALAPDFADMLTPGPHYCDTWCAALGLDNEARICLRTLPEKVRLAVIADFDPRIVQDGNVWGTLFPFVRTVWAKLMEVESEMLETLKAMPYEMQKEVMKDPSFDAQPEVHTPSLPLGQTSVPAIAMASAMAPAIAPTFAPAVASRTPTSMVLQAPQTMSTLGVQQMTTADGVTFDPLDPYALDDEFCATVSRTVTPSSEPTSQIKTFCARWGLDANAATFIGALPKKVMDAVLDGFSMNSEKEGNAWGKLMGFARREWGRIIGLDPNTIAYMRTFPEEVQVKAMMKFDTAGTKGGSVNQRLQGCLRKIVAQSDLPPKWGRAEREASGSQRPAPLVGGGFNDSMSGAKPFSSYRAGADYGPGSTVVFQNVEPPDIDTFVSGFGLDGNARRRCKQMLQDLPNDLQAAVVSNFNPSGTKDGNALGRLEAYVKSVSSRRKRAMEASVVGGTGSGDRNVRGRAGQ